MKTKFKAIIGAAILTFIPSLVTQVRAETVNFTETNPVNYTESSPYQSNEYDGDALGGALNPTDLIHRANLAPSRSGTEFNEDSQRSLDEAAAEFRRQQQEQLKNPQQPIIP